MSNIVRRQPQKICNSDLHARKKEVEIKETDLNSIF